MEMHVNPTEDPGGGASPSEQEPEEATSKETGDGDGDGDTRVASETADTIECGCLGPNDAMGSALVLDEVLLPLIQNGFAGDEATSRPRHADHAANFVSRLLRAAHLEEGGAPLTVPFAELDDDDGVGSKLLERHFQTLADGTLSTIFDILPSLVGSIRMVTTVSRHYNRDERLVPLMERIAWQLQAKVKEHVDLTTILRGNANDAKSALSESKQLLEAWRLTFMEVRARIDGEGECWNFDTSPLFEKTDYSASICSDLHEAVVVMEQFRTFIAVTGEGGGGGDVAAKVEALPVPFETIDFDIFDGTQNEKWNDTLEDFNKGVRAAEACAGSSIERAFQKLRSAESSFDMVEKFSSIRSRPSIHSRIEQRYSDILEQYMSELERIERDFESCKENPPIFKSSPPTSGSIAWANDLYQRAKRPILRFRRRDGLLSSDYGTRVKERYLDFARSIDTYKGDLIKTWEDRVPSVAFEGLRRPILTRLATSEVCMTFERREGTNDQRGCDSSCDASRSMCNSFSTSTTRRSIHIALSGEYLACNFSKGIIEMINEAKHLDRMGFPIPKAVLAVVMQEDTYQRYIMGINEMTREYNTLLASVSNVEMDILKNHIRVLNLAVQPGLSTLNWMSQRIPAFLVAGNQALERFKSVLVEVRKHSRSIEKLISKVENMTLVSESDFSTARKESMSIFDFSSVIEGKAKERLDALVHAYQSIKPILVKVEICVTETDDGASPLLSTYYAFWEKRIYNALTQMTIRSLSSLLRLASERTAMCRMSVQLSGKDLVFVPPLADVYKHVNRCIRTVTESSKRFIRWMRGTCIEANPTSQSKGDEVSLDDHAYSFYDDVSQNCYVVECLVHLNQKFHGIFKRLLNYTKDWRECGKTLLWVPQKNMTFDQELDPCSSYESAIAQFEELEASFRASATSGSLVGGLQAQASMDFFLVDCTEVALGMKTQAKDCKENVGESLHMSARKRLESFNAKAAKFRAGLDAEAPHTLDQLKSVLECIREIDFADMEMNLLVFDIKERYETLVARNIIVPPEEVTVALAAGSHWQSLVVNSKTRDLRLANMKGKFREMTRTQCAEFELELQKEKNRLIQSGPGSSSVSLDEGLVMLDEDWRVTVDQLETKRKDLIHSETMLGLPPSSFTDLVAIASEMSELSQLYDVFRAYRNFRDSHGLTPWIDVETHGLKAGAAELEERCLQFSPDRCNFTYSAIRDSIRVFRESIDLMESLKEGLEPRHWEKLAIITGTEVRKAVDKSEDD